MKKNFSQFQFKLGVKRTTFIALISATCLIFSGCSGAAHVVLNDSPEFTTIHYESTTTKVEVAQATTQTTQSDETTVATTENTTSVEPTTSSDNKYSDKIDKKLAQMTLYEKVCQMFITTQEQLTGVGQVTISGDMSKKAIEKYPVGGIIYFSPNIQNPAQVTSLVKNIQSFSKTPLFISVDEEGGQISRISSNSKMGTTSFPDMAEIKTEKDAYLVGKTIGSEIKEYGFNLDLAPVSDVNSNVDNPVIGTRSFSSDPETTGKMVSKCVSGFTDAGILCTLKHFPGHGDTTTDSHLDVAKTDKTLEEMEKCELIPFKAGINAGAEVVMVGHINAPELSGENIPAEFSKYIVTDLLRNKLSFKGIIMTDSMQMQAITKLYSSSEAAVNVVKAGVDIILTPQNLEEAVNGIIKAVESGDIKEDRIDESVRRILQVKYDAKIIK